MNHLKTLQQAIQYFSDEQTCIDAVAAMRWPDGKPTCPSCAGKDHYYLATQKRWKCKECGRQFSVKRGTIFENSPIGLDKWLVAVWMIANCKNGVSSYEIHRAIGVTQKSAWFMGHRIRTAMKPIQPTKIGGGSGACEADESYIGGKLQNMHRSRKREMNMEGSGARINNKTVVMGVLDRKKGEVRAEVIPHAKRDTMQALVMRHVKFGSTVFTDDHVGYSGLSWKYDHEAINKQVEGYIKGKIHTQGIENFWALLKRGLGGTYVAVEPAHLFRYVDEQVYRFNNKRKELNDGDRFRKLLTQVTGKRLTFAEVTGKVGETTA